MGPRFLRSSSFPLISKTRHSTLQLRFDIDWFLGGEKRGKWKQDSFSCSWKKKKKRKNSSPFFVLVFKLYLILNTIELGSTATSSSAKIFVDFFSTSKTQLNKKPRLNFPVWFLLFCHFFFFNFLVLRLTLGITRQKIIASNFFPFPQTLSQQSNRSTQKLER